MASHLHPEVSICVPAHDAERWIERAVGSALSQSHERFEVVVVDDASTDGTLERLERIDDERLRLYSNVRRLGHSGNWNRALTLTRGRLIKFLCADDLLYEDCAETMAQLFRENGRLGIVFSKRDFEFEPHDDTAAEWRAKHQESYRALGALERYNSGPVLAHRWLETGLARNVVGEPTNVMVTRDCLARIGTFALHIRQRADMDLWLRAMLSFDVGFVDRPLTRYLVRSGSVTSVNSAEGLAWMDELWLLDGLLSHPDIPDHRPRVELLRRRALRTRLRHALHRAARGEPQRLATLVRYEASRRLGRAPTRLHGSLDDPAPGSETVDRTRRRSA